MDLRWKPRRSSEDDDDVSLVEVGENVDSLLQQSAAASFGLFDDFEHSAPNSKQPFDSVEPKEVSDDDYEPLIVFEDVDQQGGEREEGAYRGVVLDEESSDGAASQSSDSEQFDLRTTRALRDHYSATESPSGACDDEHFPVVSILKDSEQRIVEELGPHNAPKQETDLSDANAAQTSGSEPDIHSTSNPSLSGDDNRLEESRDDEHHAFVSASEDVSQQISEPQVPHESVMQETDLSDADVSHTSGSDSDIPTAPAPNQSEVTDHLETSSVNEQQPVISASENVDQYNEIEDTGLSEADVSDTSDSDVSDMQLPPATIRGPCLNLIERERATVPPEIVLRGLIRDARPEMIHFTLPHSLFSPDDLRKGLQYAYSMLQAANSKLVILELLEKDTTNMSGSDLRRWVALAGDSSPRIRTEARISVIFESLSIGEMKAALEELVQSRLVMEGEAEKTHMSLLRKMVAKEQRERSMVVPAKGAANFDKEEGDISTKKRRVSEEDDETALDAFLTAIMALLMGALYLCFRE